MSTVIIIIIRIYLNRPELILSRGCGLSAQSWSQTSSPCLAQCGKNLAVDRGPLAGVSPMVQSAQWLIRPWFHVTADTTQISKVRGSVLKVTLGVGILITVENKWCGVRHPKVAVHPHFLVTSKFPDFTNGATQPVSRPNMRSTAKHLSNIGNSVYRSYQSVPKQP